MIDIFLIVSAGLTVIGAAMIWLANRTDRTSYGAFPLMMGGMCVTGFFGAVTMACLVVSIMEVS